MKKGLAKEKAEQKQNREVVARAQDAQGPGESLVNRGQDKSGEEGRSELSRTGCWNCLLTTGFVLHRRASWAAGNPGRRKQARSEEGLD